MDGWQGGEQTRKDRGEGRGRQTSPERPSELVAWLVERNGKGGK